MSSAPVRDPGPNLFSPSYDVARQRFREAAAAARAAVETYPIDAPAPGSTPLAIDVAFTGAREPQRVVVVSSGLHGVEGFFGSAVQLAWLRGVRERRVSVPPLTAVVLVHAVNPFGLAWRRRANEDNVDLNRNFLAAGEPYAGAPARYDDVHRLLNPMTPPSRLEPFRLKAAWAIWRFGIPALQTAVAVGQYEHPAGLFFGGNGPSASTSVVQREFWRWTRSAPDVVHIDLHTGLGVSGGYQLIVEPPNAPHLDWYRRRFDAERLVSVADGDSYPARGVMGAWLARHAGERRYRFVCAEFGTHPVVRVLGALRAENRAHRCSEPGSLPYARAKRELVECFCPSGAPWRRVALRQGLDLLRQAVEVSRTDQTGPGC